MNINKHNTQIFFFNQNMKLYDDKKEEIMI